MLPQKGHGLRKRPGRGKLDGVYSDTLARRRSGARACARDAGHGLAAPASESVAGRGLHPPTASSPRRYGGSSEGKAGAASGSFVAADLSGRLCGEQKLLASPSQLSLFALGLPQHWRHGVHPRGAPQIYQLRDQPNALFSSFEEWKVPGNADVFWFKEKKSVITVPSSLQDQPAQPPSRWVWARSERSDLPQILGGLSRLR